MITYLIETTVRVLGQEEFLRIRNLLEMIHITPEMNSVNFRTNVDNLSGMYHYLQFSRKINRVKSID